MATLPVRTRVGRQKRRQSQVSGRPEKERGCLSAYQPSPELSGRHTRAVGCVRKLTQREGGVGVNRNGTGQHIMVATLAVAGGGQFCARGCQHSEGNERQGWVREAGQ